MRVETCAYSGINEQECMAVLFKEKQYQFTKRDENVQQGTLLICFLKDTTIPFVEVLLTLIQS